MGLGDLTLTIEGFIRGDRMQFNGVSGSAPPAAGGCLWNADYVTDEIYKLNQSGTKISSFASPSNAPLGLTIDYSDRL